MNLYTRPYIISTLFIPIIVSFYSCEDVIQVDLQEGQKRIVVEANLIKDIHQDTKTLQTITLTQTEGFYDTLAPLPAQGAIVNIVNEQGDTSYFEESAPGIYTNNTLLLHDASRLTLHIDYLGEHYQATDHIRQVPKMDTIYIRREKTEFDEDSVWAVIGGFSDPVDITNFYLWEIIHLDRDTIIFFSPGDDIYLNGGVIKDTRINFFYQPAQDALIRVYQHAISQEAFDYYNYLFKLITQPPGPFDTPPVPAKGNIANTTDPAHYPLGYFRLTEADFRDIKVQ